MIDVDLDLFNQKLDNFKAVSLDCVKNGCLLFVVLVLEVQVILFVKFLDCLQTAVHDCVM